MSLKNTILIVDDDHEINELLTMSLKREGFQTISAYTGVEALRACTGAFT